VSRHAGSLRCGASRLAELRRERCKVEPSPHAGRIMQFGRCRWNGNESTQFSMGLIMKIITLLPIPRQENSRAKEKSCTPVTRDID